MGKRVFIFVLSAGLFVSSPAIIWAADENMDSSVYLTFDPVTGQFTSATKDLSKPNLDDLDIQPAPAQSATGATDVSAAAAPATDSSMPAQNNSSGGHAISWPVIVAALVLAGAVGFVLMRKGATKTTT